MLCIPKHLINVFKEKVKSGEITPEKLMDMTTEQRHELFARVLGKTNAANVNALFESKLLLKAQQDGIIKWAQEVVGMKPEIKRDILSRVSKMDKLLTPESQEAFLSDLVAHKLGMTVTMEEAGNIASLAKTASDFEKQAPKVKDIFDETPEQHDARVKSGRALVEFQDYVAGLKEKSKQKTPFQWVMPKNWGEGITTIAGLAKSAKASFDNSVIGRQGRNTLFNHPEIWAKNSAQSFKDWAGALKGVDVMKEVRADILSRPNARNGKYRRAGLAIGVKEEAYPSSFWEKLPILGRVFKASEQAFTAWQYRTRADVFDLLNHVAEKSGAETEGLGEFVNSMTGRGHLGPAEPSANMVNNIFFSPRFLRSQIDTLTAHAFSKDMSPFVRQRAAMSTAKVVIGVATVLAIAKALNPDSVETDPRSSDFGKIKIGNTRFDVSGGAASVVTLASRLISMSTKSSSTKAISKLNSGKFGSRNAGDVFIDFLGGKLSPMAGIFRDMAKGKDFQGKKVTLAGEAVNLLAPLPITNAIELYNDPNSAPMLAALIADGLGIGTNTYSSDVDWSENEGKELAQFKKQVGDVKFNEANKLFNAKWDSRIDHLTKTSEYEKLSDDDKRALITKEKSKIKQEVFDRYNFKYKHEKSTELPEIK